MLVLLAATSHVVWAEGSASPVESEELGNAVAGPLVFALSQQFGGRDVDLHFKRLATLPLGDGASMVSGTGVVRVVGHPGSPLDFSFRVPWNASRRQAGYPELSIGGIIAGERHVPNDGALVRQLEADVTQALGHHLGQDPWVRLDRIATVETGQRFLRMQASGMVYSHGAGAGTPLVIEALFDRTRRNWQRLDYALGEAPARRVSAR